MKEGWNADGATPVRELGWYLETIGNAGQVRSIPIHVLPFRIGRRRGLELELPADTVSNLHAELYSLGSGLRLRDLGSKNGTFVNRAPVEDAVVRDGDILHFADFEFRLARSEATESTVTPTTVVDKGAKGTKEFRDMLREEQVTVAFQPIVLLSRGTIAAYEALGRGRHPQLPDTPTALFDIAQSIGKEAELSRLFRKKAVELAAPRSDLPTLFLNTYPTELKRPGLLESLEELRRTAPHLDLALEIHESMLSRPAAIAELRRLLLERNIALAYDDFGAGQARLLELAEAPPHYLKFDQRFICGLDRAPLAKRRLLQSLLSVAQDQLVKTVAEGIETAAEARACAEIGFTHGQGFYMGRPRPIEEI